METKKKKEHWPSQPMWPCRTIRPPRTKVGFSSKFQVTKQETYSSHAPQTPNGLCPGTQDTWPTWHDHQVGPTHNTQDRISRGCRNSILLERKFWLRCPVGGLRGKPSATHPLPLSPTSLSLCRSIYPSIQSLSLSLFNSLSPSLPLPLSISLTLSPRLLKTHQVALELFRALATR